MKTLAIAVLLVISVALATNHFLQFGGNETAKVESVNVSQESIKETLVIPGYVSPLKRLDISSQISGKVAKVHVREGDSVVKGQLLVSMTDDEMKVTEEKEKANLEKTRQDEKAAKRSYDRLSELLRLGGVAQQEVMDAEIKWESAKKLVEVQKKNLELVALESKKLALVAPFTGVISELLVEEGQWLTSSSVIGGILDNTSVEVIAETDPADLQKLALSQPVSIVLTTTNENKSEYSGKISRIGVEAKSEKRSNVVKVFIQLTNERSDLRIGQLVDVEVVTRLRKDVVAVPAASLIQRRGGAYVALVYERKVKLVKVETGIADFYHVEIVKGLELGESIIYDPYSSIADGDEVELLHLSAAE